MIRLKRFANRLHAEHAAIFLRRNGVDAIVVGDFVQDLLGGSFAPKILQVELMLSDASQKDDADRLLEEFENVPIELEPDWEQEAQPELSGVDLSPFDLTCLGCSYNLAGLARIGLCPECGHEYDFVSLIVTRHGPEALASLFAHAPDHTWKPRVRCNECRRDITDLPVRGRCPACGKLFDKEHD